MTDARWCRESGERLREIRVRLRYTQDHLAKLAGIDSLAVKRWELGQSMPSETTSERIYKALGIHAWQILYGADIEWSLPA